MNENTYTHDVNKTFQDCTVTELKNSIVWCKRVLSEKADAPDHFLTRIKEKMEIAKAELANRIGRK